MSRLIPRAGSHEPMQIHQHHLNVSFRDDPLWCDRVLPGHGLSNEGHHPEGQHQVGFIRTAVAFEIPQRLLTNEKNLKKKLNVPMFFFSFLSSIDQSIYTFPQPSRRIR